MPLVLQLPIKYDCNIILILHYLAKAPRLRTTDLGNSLSRMTQTWVLYRLTLLEYHLPKTAASTSVHQHQLLCHLGNSYHQVPKQVLEKWERSLVSTLKMYFKQLACKNSAAVSGTEIEIGFSMTSSGGNLCSFASCMVRVPASVREKQGALRKQPPSCSKALHSQSPVCPLWDWSWVLWYQRAQRCVIKYIMTSVLEQTKGHSVSCLTMVNRGCLKEDCKKQLKHGLT